NANAQPSTLSLHDALPILALELLASGGDEIGVLVPEVERADPRDEVDVLAALRIGHHRAIGRRHDDGSRDGQPLRDEAFAKRQQDRKSTRLNSSHVASSYA